jgi:prepilin signal peptidase PulO-like enzyme (type II secretory pathway)
MNSPTNADNSASSNISKGALRAMVTILVVIFLLAVYANVQRLRRSRIETVKFTPALAASPSATP